MRGVHRPSAGSFLLQRGVHCGRAIGFLLERRNAADQRRNRADIPPRPTMKTLRKPACRNLLNSARFEHVCRQPPPPPALVENGTSARSGLAPPRAPRDPGKTAYQLVFRSVLSNLAIPGIAPSRARRTLTARPPSAKEHQTRHYGRIQSLRCPRMMVRAAFLCTTTSAATAWKPHAMRARVVPRHDFPNSEAPWSESENPGVDPTRPTSPVRADGARLSEDLKAAPGSRETNPAGRRNTNPAPGADGPSRSGASPAAPRPPRPPTSW